MQPYYINELGNGKTSFHRGQTADLTTCTAGGNQHVLLGKALLTDVFEAQNGVQEDVEW